MHEAGIVAFSALALAGAALLLLKKETLRGFWIWNTQSAAPTPANVLRILRNTEKKLIRRRELFAKKIESEIANATKHATTNKRLALQALKRKKQHEKLLNKMERMLFTIKFQRETLENVSATSEESFLLEEIVEQCATANAILNPVTFEIGHETDEDELIAELEHLYPSKNEDVEQITITFYP